MTYVLHIIVMAAIQMSSVLGYNLIFGKGKILHFGPIATSIVSAYAIFLTLKATGSYPLALLAGCAAALAMSALFAWLSLRLDGDAFGILSIALHLAVLAVVLNWTSLTRGALGIPQIPKMPGLGTQAAFASVVILVACAYGWWVHRITAGTVGRALSALAENRTHAEAVGVSSVKATWIAFLAGGIGAFLSNAFFPQYIGLLHPNDYTFQALVFMVMCSVAGGPGRVAGVASATVLLMFLKEGIRFLPIPLSMVGSARLVLFGLVLMIAVYARRKTLFPKPRTI